MRCKQFPRLFWGQNYDFERISKLFRQTLEGRDRRPIVPKIPHVAPAVYESDAAVVSFTKRLAQSSVWRENTPPSGRCGLPTRRGRGADDYRPQDMNVPRLQQQFCRQTGQRRFNRSGAHALRNAGRIADSHPGWRIGTARKPSAGRG